MRVNVQVLDWDRHAEGWRALDDVDDGFQFSISGLEDIATNTSEVAVAVSVSYGVDLPGVAKKVGDLPIIHLELENRSPDAHWSDEKQRTLGKQFLDTIIALSSLGVRQIHLFMAAQNSICFRFGRLYDKRNLPQIVVYQYQREESPPYPWGISMPVAGITQPEVLKNT